MKKGIYIYFGRNVAFVFLCLILLTFCGCARDSEFKTLPSSVVENALHESITHYLADGASIESFDAQAIPALESGLAKHWYPIYLATVVIAVDRGKTDVQIGGWNDLTIIHEKVGFNNSHMHAEMLMLAMAYGLEGDGFTLDQAAYIWSLLQAENRLEQNSFEAPVVICYDYQAAAQIKNGRNFEVIIPREGTLTYEKGILSNTGYEFMVEIESMLLSEGFRLPDGHFRT